MRWRSVDRVDGFVFWERIQARKGVTLEEYYIYSQLGREGVLPETLAVEVCVQSCRWLVERSSEFELSCLLTSLSDLEFDCEAGRNALLMIDSTVSERTEKNIILESRISIENSSLLGGIFEFDLIPLGEIHDPVSREIMWGELYATA